jgi:hypothetical protein
MFCPIWLAFEYGREGKIDPDLSVVPESIKMDKSAVADSIHGMM